MDPAENNTPIYTAEDGFFKSLIETLPVEIAIYNEEGRFVYTNENTSLFFQQAKQEVIGKTFDEIFSKETADSQYETLRKIFATGQSMTVDRKFKLNGQQHFFKIQHQPIFDENGKVKSVMVIGQNLTTQTREEQLFGIQHKIDALSNQTISLENTLKKAFEFLLEIDWIDVGGVYLFDDKKEKLKLIYSTGLSDNYIRKVKIFSANEAPAVVVLKGKSRYIKMIEFLEPIKTVMERENLAFVATIPLIYKRQVIGSINLGSKSVTDINWQDKKIIESIATRLANLIMLIKTREQLISANIELHRSLRNLESQNQLLIQKSRLESLGELAASLTHEINQPLSVISLVAENLNYKLNPESKEDSYLTGKFNTIFQNINKIRQLIDHFRIFSRDQGVIMFEKVDVNGVIHGALSMIGVQLNNHQIKVVTDLSENLGYTLGNPSRLEQVMLNLLSNARDAINEKAEKSLGVPVKREIRIQSSREDKTISIRIIDTGSGIPEENLEKIFDPFFTTKEAGKGSGLGLAIVYGIITEMKGTIKVRSEKNSFTEIILNFPGY